jgi:ATP citrate (pro-S)-lyase
VNIAALRKQNMTIVTLGSHPGIIQSMLDYDFLCGRKAPRIAAIVSNGSKSERYFWGEAEIEIPVVPTIDKVPNRETVQCVMVVQSGRRAAAGMLLALEKLPALKVGVLFAEQVPEAHALKLAETAHQRKVLVIGPASVGLLIPGVLKLGAIGGTQHRQLKAARITRPGNTAVVSTSGGMVNELIHAVTGANLGVSFAMALGGDRFPITTPAEAFLLAESDPATKQIVYFGELGGVDEYEIAQLIKDGKLTKKIIAYVAGAVAELFETPPQFGHAKAMAESHDETASAKKTALREVNVQVIETFGELSPTLAASKLPKMAGTDESQTIGERQHRLIVSHLSGDRNGGPELLGKDLLQVVTQNTIASQTISMLLGKQITSKKLIDCTDYVLRLLADHGPYVSGAVNTIIAARAGKDLVSSLSAGLLTIGPRFGGAINQAAANWLRGVQSGDTPRGFVETYRGIIQGIGHKKYRIDMPDPRVAALQKFAVKNGKYLQFAFGVQTITTAKKGNLILNVDGAIAAIMLDILSTELHYTTEQLQELVDIEFFNALFVLSRSIGFVSHYLDQRRHDEGLLRLSDQEVGYFPE